MSKLYIFGIGGTGSRVLRSLTMLLASGVKLGSDIETIVPIIIDPDMSNADLTRTDAIISSYKKINESLKIGRSQQNQCFFDTKIESVTSSDDIVLDMGELRGQKFQELIRINKLSKENEAMVRMLFSEKNLQSDMSVGFKGNPNIGSVVLNKIVESSGFEAFANDFIDTENKIFIISSIFGGTGASGFPILLKNLRNLDKIPNNSCINNAHIGAVSVLPYFTVKQNNKGENEIEGDTFISKTKSALAYYENNLNSIDDLYFLSDNSRASYEYSVGGSEQKNSAHLIEFLAATAIVDFTYRTLDNSKNATQRKPRYYEFGLDNDDNPGRDIDLTHFYKDANYERVFRPMIQFSLLKKLFDTKYDYMQNKMQSTFKHKDIYKSSSMIEFKNFIDSYKVWLDEMSHNTRALQLFNFGEKNPFAIVRGKSPMEENFFSKDKYDLFISTINNQSVIKNSQLQEQFRQFVEMLYDATEKLVNDKILNA